MQAFKILLIIVFIFLLIAISTPASSAVVVPPTGLNYRDCGNHVYARAGDTLNAIATRCGTTLSALLAVNPSLSANGDQVLAFGTKVIMPAKTITVVQAVTTVPQTIVVNSAPAIVVVPTALPVTGASVYTVQPGDTLSKIARNYNTTIAGLIQLNPTITDPNLIYAGQVLVVP